MQTRVGGGGLKNKLRSIIIKAHRLCTLYFPRTSVVALLVHLNLTRLNGQWLCVAELRTIKLSIEENQIELDRNNSLARGVPKATTNRGNLNQKLN